MDTANGSSRLLHHELTGAVLGAFFEVYNELGQGFVETAYQRALPIAWKAKGIASEREVPLVVRSRGEVVGDYRGRPTVDSCCCAPKKNPRSPGSFRVHPRFRRKSPAPRLRMVPVGPG